MTDADDRRNLTDMSASDYDVDALKEEFRRNRRENVARLRREGKFDEEGEEFQTDFDARAGRRLLSYLKPYRLQLAAGILLLLGYSAVAPAFPSLFALAVDDYLVAGRGLTSDERFSRIITIVLIYMGLRVLSFVLRYAYTYVIEWLGQHINYDIRHQIFAKIQRLHMGFFDRTPVGRLLTRITSDVDAIQQMLTDGVVGIIADLGMIAGLLVYMFIINWQLALITIAVMPVLFIVLNFLRFRIRDAYRSVRLRTSISNAYLAEHLT